MAVRPQADDVVAFDELWQYRGRVRAVCNGLATRPVDAEDLVQETYLRVLTTSRPPDRRGPLAAWLTTVARHRAIDRLRADGHVEVMPSEFEVVADVDPADSLLKTERRERVRRALGELQHRERRLLVRQAVHELSITELAAEERTSEASVRSVLWRARRKFRAALDRGGPLGAAPVSSWANPWQRLRELRHRMEASGVPWVAGLGVHLAEALVVLASALLLSSSSSTSSPAGAVVSGAGRIEAVRSATENRTGLLRPARVGTEVEAEGVRSWVDAEVGARVPSGRLQVGTDADGMGTEVVLEFEPTAIKVTVELTLPEPVGRRRQSPSVSCDDTPPLTEECRTMAMLAETTEPLLRH